MEDLDLKEFISSVKIWGILVAVFGTLAIIIFINKFGAEDININRKIDSKKSLVILVVKSDTKNTKALESKLKNDGFKYETVYSDKERYYGEFLIKLSLTEKEVAEPTILYVEDGKAIFSLVDAKESEELDEFLKQLNEYIDDK